MIAPSATHRYKLDVYLTLSDVQLQFLQQRHADVQALSPETPFPFENFLLSTIHTQFMLWLLQQTLGLPAQARAVGESGGTQ